MSFGSIHVADNLFTAIISFNTVTTEAKKVSAAKVYLIFATLRCKITGTLHAFDVSVQIHTDKLAMPYVCATGFTIRRKDFNSRLQRFYE